MSVYGCKVCGFRYDEWLGDTKNGVPPGVPFSRLAGSVCTTCGLQGGRHNRLPEVMCAGLEATYYDQFAGKAGIAFYRDWLMREAGPVSVLELGVGTGRIAIELARNGISVCGVDCSPDMLALAGKKKRRMLKENESLLELVEQDVYELDVNRRFTHVLVPEGLFQQSVSRPEQRKLLGLIRQHLAEGGTVAIDVLLPPAKERWELLQRKFVFPDRMVYQRIEGETSFSRQKIRYTLTYETFLEQMEQPRYRVEREMALLLPGEMVLLLESEGFSVRAIYDNFQWEPVHESTDGYDMDRWQHGGYPFVPEAAASTSPSRYTVIAQKSL